jgi:hypothetical protein
MVLSRNGVHTVHTSSSFLLKKKSSQLFVELWSQAAKPIEAFDDADDSVYWPRGFLLDRSKLGAFGPFGWEIGGKSSMNGELFSHVRVAEGPSTTKSTLLLYFVFRFQFLSFIGTHSDPVLSSII